MVEEMNDLKVSVCLITYNHVHFIRNAIDSILEQDTFFNWNLIIADDNSTDGTTNILKDYAKKFPDKIVLILQKFNVGMHKNFVDLFTSAKGKYVAFLDGDDKWTDNKRLQKQYDFLEANPQYGMVYGKYSLMNKMGNPITLKKYPTYKSGNIFKDVITHSYLPPMASSLMRNDLIQKIYKDSSAMGNDFYLIASLCRISKAAFVNENYYTYRINEGSITSSQVPQMSALCLKNMSLFEKEYPLEVKEGLKNWRLKQLYFAVDKKPDISNFLLLIKNFNFSAIHIRQVAKCLIKLSKPKI